MKERVILAINVVVVLGLVAASAYQANQWRTEGTEYSAKRKADGNIARNAMVAKAKGEAEVIKARHTAPADRDRAAMQAAAAARAKGIEARADTEGTVNKTASTRAQADAVRVIDNRANEYSGAHVPNPFPTPRGIAPSVIDEGPNPTAPASRPGIAPSVIDEGKAGTESLWKKSGAPASKKSLWKKAEPPVKKNILDKY